MMTMGSSCWWSRPWKSSYDGGHTSSVMGLGDVVDGLYVAEVFLSGGRGGASACEATRDGINGAS